MSEYIKISYIYSLLCPLTGDIKYIGKTINPKIRFNNHIKEFRGKNKKINWIKSLYKKNLLPIMKIIEVVPFENEDEKEIYWINYYKNLGCDLKNMTTGGSGRRNPDENHTSYIIRSDGKIFKSLKDAGEYHNVPYNIISNAIKYRTPRFGYRFGYLGQGIPRPQYTPFKVYASDGKIFYSRNDLIKFYKIKDKNFDRALQKGFAINGVQFSKTGIFKEFIPPNAKLVKCINNNIIYKSCHHAAKELNLNYKSISRCALGQRKTYKGFSFIYINEEIS